MQLADAMRGTNAWLVDDLPRTEVQRWAARLMLPLDQPTPTDTDVLAFARAQGTPDVRGTLRWLTENGFALSEHTVDRTRPSATLRSSSLAGRS